jgi:hypothetical protein
VVSDPDETAADETAALAPTAGPGAAGAEASWGLDAVIGAAAVAARATRSVAGAVSSTAPVRAAAGAARWLTQPLAREGEEVRERLGHEAGPAATGVIRQVTPGVLGALDLDAVLAAIDLNTLLGRVDVDAVIDRVDVDAIVDRVDVDAIVQRVDVAAIVERIDIGSIVERIDIGSIVERIDLDALLEQIDLDRLLERIDLDALLERVDLDSLIQRLDMDALVATTDLGSIIAQSTSGVASEALDAVRSQGVGLDNVVGRLANRILRRDPAELPAGPPGLVGDRLALPAGDGTPGGASREATP